MKYAHLVLACSLFCHPGQSQTYSLSQILDSISSSNASMKMYDAQVNSLDAAARGARNWMAPQVSTGLWMAPYNINLWKGDGKGGTGMGQYMVSAEQMFPVKKLNDANEAYMKSMSSVEKENKQAVLNELFAVAKHNYYAWIILQKKLSVLTESEHILKLIIGSAENRYKNGLEKINAYYKAKAALGNLESMRISEENEIGQKRIVLNTLMNRDKSALLQVDTNYVWMDYSGQSFDSSLIYERRSDLRAIDRNIQLLALQQNMERAGLKPQFGVRYDHMFGFGGLPMQYSLMGMVRIPVNRSTRSNKANMESLSWKSQSLEEQKHSLANEYEGMAAGLQKNMAAKKKQLLLYENNILPSLKNNFEVMRLAFEQDTQELFELYDAWFTLTSSRMEYIDLLGQLMDLQVDFEKILQIKPHE